MSDRLAQDLANAAEATDKLVCVVWGLPVGTEDAYRTTLLGSSRLATFRTARNRVTAVKAYLTTTASPTATAPPSRTPRAPRRRPSARRRTCCARASSSASTRRSSSCGRTGSGCRASSW